MPSKLDFRILGQIHNYIVSNFFLTGERSNKFHSDAQPYFTTIAVTFVFILNVQSKSSWEMEVEPYYNKDL